MNAPNQAGTATLESGRTRTSSPAATGSPLQTPREYAHIEGWGADLDHANRPAYPRERTPPRLEGVHWDQPEQQQQTVEILKSNERPTMTPVFGTSTPPSGVSGSMRRFAFRFSENDIRHWLLLLAADRVNVVEGLVDDLSRGHIPNIFAEMGGKAELKHNPAGAARKALVVVGILGVGYLLLRGDGDRRRGPRPAPGARRMASRQRR